MLRSSSSGVGTNKHCLNDLVFIACAFKLQVHKVVFCPLFIIPLRRHTELWDDPDEMSLLLVSLLWAALPKALPRRDLEAGVGHSNGVERTSPGFVARTDPSLLSVMLGCLKRGVSS